MWLKVTTHAIYIYSQFVLIKLVQIDLVWFYFVWLKANSFNQFGIKLIMSKIGHSEYYYSLAIKKS